MFKKLQEEDIRITSYCEKKHNYIILKVILEYKTRRVLAQ